MPIVKFTDDELQALYDAFTIAEKVNWPAYDAAKRRVIITVREELKHDGQDSLADRRDSSMR